MAGSIRRSPRGLRRRADRSRWRGSRSRRRGAAFVHVQASLAAGNIRPGGTALLNAAARHPRDHVGPLVPSAAGRAEKACAAIAFLPPQERAASTRSCPASSAALAAHGTGARAPCLRNAASERIRPAPARRVRGRTTRGAHRTDTLLAEIMTWVRTTPSALEIASMRAECSRCARRWARSWRCSGAWARGEVYRDARSSSAATACRR